MMRADHALPSRGAQPAVGPELRFCHRFRLRAEASAVADFHRRAESLRTITPPLLLPRVSAPPGPLDDGDLMLLRLGFAPLEIRWLARIEQVEPLKLADRQLDGPFASWLHRHTFVPLGNGLSEVSDEVRASLRRHPLWGPLGLVM
jgi:ligand-binding SRPBCC domain-containing protein